MLNGKLTASETTAPLLSTHTGCSSGHARRRAAAAISEAVELAAWLTAQTALAERAVPPRCAERDSSAARAAAARAHARATTGQTRNLPRSTQVRKAKMGKTIRGARKGKNSIFTAHTRLRKGPVRLRKIDYAEKCAGRVPLSRLFDRPIGATAARQIPVLKVTCSNHVSVTAALSLGGPGGGLQFHSRFATERFDSVWAATAGLV